MTMVKTVIDVFGSTIIVPVVVFILSLIMRVKPKDAFKGALFMGVGLTAFNIILGSLMGSLSPMVTQMVKNTGINLPGIDVGWPAGAVIVYANTIGMFYLVFGLLVNLVLFLTKWTDTFQPTDIWNYYQFVFWAAIVQYVTGSFWLGVACATYLNLIVLLIADWIAPSLQEHYGYDGVTSTCICAINGAPFAILIKWLLKKLKLDKVRLDPTTLRDKIGFFGEPVTMGLIVGIVISFIASLNALGQMATWASILTTGIVTGAIMALYPAVSGLFVKGLIPISQKMSARAQSGQMRRKNFYISLDPAVYFGEEANLTAGLIMIPIMLLIAVIQPGNRMLPLADLAAMPFMVIGITAVMKGNIFGTVIAGTIWYTIGQALNSTILEIFTKAAATAGVAEASQGALVSAWTLGVVPYGWLGYKAFAASGTMKVLTILIAVAVYLAVYFAFRKNKVAWQIAAGASPEFMEAQKAKELGKAAAK